MTRINAGIKPEQLTDSHLVAEYREISRVGTLVRKRVESGRKFSDIPSEFTLGTGHVRFFYDKGGYIVSRWRSLVAEMRRRKFEAQDVWDTWEDIPRQYMNDWDDSPGEQLLKERIRERVSGQKRKPRYYSQDVELNHYLENILKLKTHKLAA